MVRHHNSFGGLGLIDRISQESHTALMLLVELVKSQRLSVEKNPMEICYSILSGKGSLKLLYSRNYFHIDSIMISTSLCTRGS